MRKTINNFTGWVVFIGFCTMPTIVLIAFPGARNPAIAVLASTFLMILLSVLHDKYESWKRRRLAEE